jgi:hypothetical protein
VIRYDMANFRLQSYGEPCEEERGSAAESRRPKHWGLPTHLVQEQVSQRCINRFFELIESASPNEMKRTRPKRPTQNKEEVTHKTALESAIRSCYG